jgi:hypothetical protein
MPYHHASRSYLSGELVPQDGLYLVFHPSRTISYGTILFDKGEPFPLCLRCDDVRYTLLRSLPPDLRLRNHKPSQRPQCRVPALPATDLRTKKVFKGDL